MTIKLPTITPQQFDAMVALTGIHRESQTHQALYRHYVLGVTRNQAAVLSNIKPAVLYRSIEALELAAARAREYVRLNPPAPAPAAGRASRPAPAASRQAGSPAS